MKSIKNPVHAFIVRIWIEHRENKDANPIWRRVVEQVEGNQRMYFDHLDTMNAYFANYLEQMGIKIAISPE